MSETRTTKKRSTVKPSEQTGDKPVEVGVDGAVESSTQRSTAKPKEQKTTTVKTAATEKPAAKAESDKTDGKKAATSKTSASKASGGAKKPTVKSSTGSATGKPTAKKQTTNAASAKSTSGAKRSTATTATVKQPDSAVEQKPDTAQTADVEVESGLPVENVVEQSGSISAEQAESVLPEQATEVATVDAEKVQGDNAVAKTAATESAEPKSDNASGVADKAQADSVAVGRKRKMSVVSIVFTCIGVAIVLFLFFVAVTLAVDKFVKKSPVPSFFGTSTLIVTTGSMSGTIEDGDMIVVKKSDEYKIGDIITFLPAGDSIPTTHRIIRINDGKFYTKGDANNAEDTRAVEQGDIVGKVAFTVPHVGLFFRWLKDDLGWVYLVAIVVVIIAGIVLLKQFPMNKKINKD